MKNIVGLLLVGLLGTAWPTLAHALRAVPWTPGNPVIVYLKPAQTTQIVLPEERGRFANPDSGLFSIMDLPNGVLIKPLGSFERFRLFLFGASGETYMVELLEVVGDQREDNAVHLVREQFGQPVARAEYPLFPPSEALMLLGAMHLEYPAPDYRILDGKMEILLEEPNVLRHRVRKIYEGMVYKGYEIEIENLSSDSIPVSAESWNIRGFVVGSVVDRHLAPREPKDSVDAFKGMPKKTRGFFVVRRDMFETGQLKGRQP